jgi:hypothetical protein
MSSASAPMGVVPPERTSARQAWRSSGATTTSVPASRVSTSSHAANRASHASRPCTRSHNSRPVAPATSAHSTDVFHNARGGIPKWG